MASGLSLDNQVMRDFVFYAVIVVLKMMAMSMLTVKARISNKVFANKEDIANDPKRAKLQFDFEPVERIRRNHLNDLENVVPFVLIGLLYVLSAPAPAAARIAFRLFAGSRLVHTLAYQLPLPQPARGISFVVGYLVIVYMGLATLFKVM